MLLLTGASVLLVATFVLGFMLPADSRLGGAYRILSMTSAAVVICMLSPYATSAVPTVALLLGLAAAALVLHPVRALIRLRRC